MFRIYTDAPAPAPALRVERNNTSSRCTSSGRLTKLIVRGHASDDLTLTLRLPFGSYEILNEAVENVLDALPVPKVSVSSLQYREADGDYIYILESSFDPQDFTTSDNSSADTVVHVLARVQPTADQPSSGHKVKALSTAKATDRQRRRALGTRDLNAAAVASASGGTKTISLRAGPRSLSSCTQPFTTRRERTENGGVHTVVAATSDATVTSSRPRAPRFVFGDKLRGKPLTAVRSAAAGSQKGKIQSTADGPRAATRRTGGASAWEATAARKPVWNDRAEPLWEEVLFLSGPFVAVLQQSGLYIVC